MKILLLLISLLVVAAGGIYGAGSVLPEEHVLMRGTHIARPIDDVWNAVADYDALPGWSAHITRTERLEDRNGHPVWRVEDAEGQYMVLEIEEDTAPTRHVSRIVESSYPFSGRWIFELTAQAQGGTWIKLTEEGRIPSPFVRFLMHYVLGPDTGMLQFLNSLGEKFGHPLTIEELVA